MSNYKKKLTCPIFSFISFLFKLMAALINVTFLGITYTFKFILNKIRFSIAFKINLVYCILYAGLFSTIYLFMADWLINHSKDTLSSSFTGSYLNMIHILLPISLIIFFFIGQKLVHKILEPLRNMTESVKRISGDNLDTRLNTNQAKDELKDLSITFNEMMDRIQVFVEQQKQFVSDASHELRTPVAIIQGYTDMLSRWAMEDPKILEESILAITQETANMKDLLEKLLFLSRNDRHTLKVDLHNFNLSKLCTEIIKQTIFIDDTHDFFSNVSEDISLFGDTILIKELLRILIDNAIKYTPEGGSITLNCIKTNKNIIVSVKDTGIGIPKEHIPHLFERFYRVEESRNKNTGGNGLGLAIAKQIITIHHANIFVNSQIGLGSEFIIFFPLTNDLSSSFIHSK